MAFSSDASNVVAGDTNDSTDAFLRDLLTGTTERISVDSDEAQGNGRSLASASSSTVSADGRFVAFNAFASNLVAGDTNFRLDVFVRDRVAGTTERISVDSDEVQGNFASYSASISADGRFVAFFSDAWNLFAGDTNNSRDVFVRDRFAGTTERVSISRSSGGLADSHSDHPEISPDGRFVAFYSEATNLVAGDTNARSDIFVRDRLASTTERVSLRSGGGQADGHSDDPVMSADGRFVAFWSDATNLVAGDTNGVRDVFVHDRETGVTERVSVSGGEAQGNAFSGGFLHFASMGTSISADGRFVAFRSTASNLVAGDDNNAADMFVRDRLAGTTERVSVDSAGGQANGDSYTVSISADGRFVAFESAATNLVAGDTNGFDDIFLRDRGPPDPPRNDLLVDFGTRGLFQRLNNAGPFAQIHAASPIAIAAGDLDGSGQDEAIASFASEGLRARFDNAGPWGLLHAAAPTRIVAGDFDGNGEDDLAGDFPGLGILVRVNNGVWRERHDAVSEGLAVGDLDGDGKDELIADRGGGGGGGIWARYNNAGGWVQLNARNPLRIVTADLDGNGLDEVIADRPNGLFARYNDSARWRRLHDAPSAGLAAGDLNGGGKDDLIADRGATGLWARYNNRRAWQQLDTLSPLDIATADLDQSGKSEVVTARAGDGVWALYNNAGPWQRLTRWRAEDIAAGGFD